MSNDKLFREVELALLRELTPEERKLIALADQILKRDERHRQALELERKAAG